MTVTFEKDRTIYSHWAFDVETDEPLTMRAVLNNGKNVDFHVEAGNAVAWDIQGGDGIKDIIAMFANKATKSLGKRPKNGSFFRIKGKNLTNEDMKLDLPICDVPVKIANNSGMYVYIRIYYHGGRWVWFSIRADQPPFIWFMPEHPDNIQYSDKDPANGWFPIKVIPWKSGTSVLIQPQGSENLSDSVITWLKAHNMSDWLANFNSHYIDETALFDLHEQDLREMNIPIGLRKKLLKDITADAAEQKKKKHEGTWDLFISHKQINGADLAQAIKLQLELIHPEIRTFLDVDDLNNIHSLDDNVSKSRNVILLITDGVLERPFVQKEIRAAVRMKKNIILVHDERNCKFPTGVGVPEDILPVLATKAIPYYREKVFRDTCIQQIWGKMLNE